MLRRFYVSNFRSLVNFEFKPVGVNVLIGPNNAGKTNLCAALRFLGLSVDSLDAAVRDANGETHNLTNAYVTHSDVEFQADCTLPGPEGDLEFAYRLYLTCERGTKNGRTGIRVSGESLMVTGGAFKQTLLLDNEQGKVRLLHEGRFQSHASPEQSYVETQAPTDATMLSRLYDLSTNSLANAFKKYLQSWGYYSLVPQALRAPRAARGDRELCWDGANFGHALFALHNEDPRLERSLIEAVRVVEPKLDLLAYVAPDPESVHVFLEDRTGHRFSLQSVSDGTLRFAAMAYLALRAARRDAAPPAPLLLIEEPENGLYVEHLKTLVAGLDHSGVDGQFVFTSHSPYFIDLFDGNLDGVHVMKPGSPSSFILKPNGAALSSLLDEMSLGELHFRELLTGRRLLGRGEHRPGAPGGPAEALVPDG